MQKTTALLLTALLAACGGGGGSDPITNDPFSTIRAETLVTLELCLDDALSAFLEVFSATSLAPGAAAPSIIVGDIVGLSIPFLADLDGDGSPDATGRIEFVDNGGQPIMPFVNGEIQNDVNLLLAALASLPNGTRVDIDLDPAPGIGITQARFSQTMVGGLPTALGGAVIQQSLDCTTTIQFADATILSVLGAYPRLDANVEIIDGTNTVAGTVTFNCSATAVVEVSLNGTGPFQFQVDLDSGVITPTGG